MSLLNMLKFSMQNARTSVMVSSVHAPLASLVTALMNVVTPISATTTRAVLIR